MLKHPHPSDDENPPCKCGHVEKAHGESGCLHTDCQPKRRGEIKLCTKYRPDPEVPQPESVLYDAACFGCGWNGKRSRGGKDLPCPRCGKPVDLELLTVEA